MVSQALKRLENEKKSGNYGTLAVKSSTKVISLFESFIIFSSKYLFIYFVE